MEAQEMTHILDTMAKNISKHMYAMEDKLRHELEETVRVAVAQYREGFWVKDRWCCEPMKGWATELLGLPSPPTKGRGHVTQCLWKGHPINWCLFCGAKL